MNLFLEIKNNQWKGTEWNAVVNRLSWLLKTETWHKNEGWELSENADEKK